MNYSLVSFVLVRGKEEPTITDEPSLSETV
jgi:hypothetical protein